MRVLISGLPGVGKTTLVKEIVALFPSKFGGFITEEVRDNNGKRTGFLISDLHGNSELFASIYFNSPYLVARYGVDIERFEKFAIPALEDAMSKERIVVIDEIGKMELISQRFRKIVLEIFSLDKKVLATIKLKYDTFTEKLKMTSGTSLFILERGNYNDIKSSVIKALELEI